MRLTWFTSLRAGRRRKGKRQQLKAVPLRVRQLERRRVLDGAVASVVVSTVVVADAGQPAPAATTTNATDAPPIVAPVESTVGISSSDTAHAASLSPAQGLAGNTPPVLVAATIQQNNEGQLLNRRWRSISIRIWPIRTRRRWIGATGRRCRMPRSRPELERERSAVRTRTPRTGTTQLRLTLRTTTGAPLRNRSACWLRMFRQSW